MSAIRVTVCLLFLCMGFLSWGILVSGCGGQGTKVDPVFMRSCLDDLTNVHRLASSPAGWAGMTSSFDRTGGNNDGNFDEGKAPDGRRLMADLKGPGVVRRIWLTGMLNEHKFYFYFDGEKKPRFMKTYMELSGKDKHPFAPPLCDYLSGAGFCYLPIPYEKRLVISTDPVKGGTPCFYHVNYETFPDGTQVKSLSAAMLEAVSQKIAEVGRAWQTNQDEKIMPDGAGAPMEIGPGKKIDLLCIDGPATIEELRILPVFPADQKVVDRNNLLRQLVLRIFWDDMEGPSVETPLGDFFCNGVRLRSFRSLPVVVENGVFAARFPMPFKKRARVELENSSSGPVNVSAGARSGRYVEGGHYFHAAWKQSSASGIPHEILRFPGSGYYAGCYLLDIGMDGSWNILEGDEVVYRDNEVFPSMHGTGLEDYFNAGWYFNGGVFAMPFAGCQEKAGIRSAEFRFHVPDSIAFKKRIRVNIEFGHANASRGYMSSVAYWYALDPSEVPFKLPNAKERIVPVDPLERTSIMCELFERERVGRLQEAIDLCREYSEKYPGTAESAMLDLRAVAYREALNGYDAVKPEYVKLQLQASNETVRAQSGILQWFHEADSNVIAMTHVNGSYRLYLDGRMIRSGDNPVEADIFRLTIGKGLHYLCAEYRALRADPWFSMYLRTHSTNIVTDGTWMVNKSKPDDWMASSFDKRGWRPAFAGGPFPWMRWFQFKPNAIIDSQGGKQLLYHPEGTTAGDVLYYRKDFEVK